MVALTLVQDEAFRVEFLHWCLGIAGKQEDVPVLVPHDNGRG